MRNLEAASNYLHEEWSTICLPFQPFYIIYSKPNSAFSFTQNCPHEKKAVREKNLFLADNQKLLPIIVWYLIFRGGDEYANLAVKQEVPNRNQAIDGSFGN